MHFLNKIFNIRINIQTHGKDKSLWRQMGRGKRKHLETVAILTVPGLEKKLVQSLGQGMTPGIAVDMQLFSVECLKSNVVLKWAHLPLNHTHTHAHANTHAHACNTYTIQHTHILLRCGPLAYYRKTNSRSNVTYGAEPLPSETNTIRG